MTNVSYRTASITGNVCPELLDFDVQSCAAKITPRPPTISRSAGNPVRISFGVCQMSEKMKR